MRLRLGKRISHAALHRLAAASLLVGAMAPCVPAAWAQGSADPIDRPTQERLLRTLTRLQQARDALNAEELRLQERQQQLAADELPSEDALRVLEQLRAQDPGPIDPTAPDVEEWKVEVLASLDPLPPLPSDMLDQMRGRTFTPAIDVVRMPVAITLMQGPSGTSGVAGTLSDDSILVTLAISDDNAWVLVTTTPENGQTRGFVEASNPSFAHLLQEPAQ
ncbi:MAG: hypothetical protein H6842_11090 [Rhodospirillaceae bacterium]|nr:hypothetical protein [Rhodospirillaceae bacterium]